ncbi:hypothetical protein F383_32698 [Gossypium arboreum]|nr:hypothetical protein F383_32698 [Gossypium arboreum]
MVNYRF